MARRRYMSRYPPWKVFSPEGEYVASCHYAEDAAALAGVYGPGALIRWGAATKNTVYVDGRDGDAGESVDLVAIVCHQGLKKIREREGWDG